MNFSGRPNQRFPRLRALFRRYPWLIYVVVGALLILIELIVVAIIFATPRPTIDTTPIKVTTKKKVEPVYYSPLTGIKVADETATTQAVTGIMIENSPDARPQSGLKDAGVVYEAIAEGGITRFLALYQEAKPQLIGPVRSVRLYYVDWVAPYNASIAHIGGSAAALSEVRNGSYRDIDQFFNAAYYWRASDRYAPHNVYTSFAKLDELNNAKGYTTSTFTGFARQDGKTSEPVAASSIDLTISSAWYNPHYDYDAASNTYLRSIAGEASNDREAGQLAPSVVVALKVDMVKIMEDGWRESITTTGSGTAYVFQNGEAIECTWRKASRTEPLELVDASGNTVKLNRGQTWIAAVPNNGGAVTWK
jgi:hypothetical protein